MAAPGSYLADLLGSSAPPSSPSPLADTQPIATGRDPAEEALLSSAPKPFGTTSHDLAAPPAKPRNHKWLWASLGLLALVMVGIVTGALWLQRAPRAVAEEPEVVPVQPAPVVVEPDAQVADVGTDAPVLEPIVLEAEAVVEAETAVEDEALEVVATPTPKPKKKRRKKKPVTAPVAVSEPAAEPAPATEIGTETGAGSEEDAPLEPDDGIDWTVPDLPEEPAPPTGTPDAPARNPVVIDQPPAQ